MSNSTSTSKPKHPLGLFIQPACLQHRYIRHANSSHIFERPERLRAVLLGVAAAIARLEEAERSVASQLIQGMKGEEVATANPSISTSDDLSSLLSGLSIQGSFTSPRDLSIIPPPPISQSPGQILLHHPALQLAHSPPPESLVNVVPFPSSTYLRDLRKWAAESIEMIKQTGCEIPAGLGLNQEDLYLGPGSILAIEGAIQTVCQAVDRVCQSPGTPKPPTTPTSEDGPSTPPDSSTGFSSEVSDQRPFTKAFCAIRPPGHHCGEDTPSGFCYVNNVVVGALHAYLEHDVDRAIIIDFDLHHGNGTQALVMPLNAASQAEELAHLAGKPLSGRLGFNGKPKRGWKSFYGSVHDIYSYPCEDGNIDLIKDASLSLAAHGQYIENVHLQPYSSEADFYDRIYPKYIALLEKAKVFMDETQADPERTIIFISAGFDASEHEHQGMQRHDRRVPTSFFSRYTRDIIAFAERYTKGKIVSVLEGGYSDRALMSAAMGHVIGMLGRQGEGSWWTEPELVNIEKATKKKRTGKIAPFPAEMSLYPYLTRTHALLSHFETVGVSSDGHAAFPASVANSPALTQSSSINARMTLRERKKMNLSEEDQVTPPARKGRGGGVIGSTLKTKSGEGASGPNTPVGRRAPKGKNVSPLKQDVKTERGDDMIRPAVPVPVVQDSQAQPHFAPAVSDTVARSEIRSQVNPITAAPLLHPTRNPPPADAEIKVPPISPKNEVAGLPSGDQPAVAPKIMLRFPRLKSYSPQSDAEPTNDTSSLPPVGLSTSARETVEDIHAGPKSLYPSLSATRFVPHITPITHAGADHRMDYREGSVVTTSSEEGYATAQSSVNDSLSTTLDRGQRETTTSSDASGISTGSSVPPFPGGFTRQP